MRQHFYLTLIIVQLLLLCLCCLTEYTDPDKHWDIIVFTQHWPITVCIEWEKHAAVNNCTLPPKANLWTIHGIWPTKIGTDGPNFCNNSAKFNPGQLEPILPALELYWMNIEANTPLYSLWKHEWLKHGSCAAQLPTFENELKYFGKGLEWIQKFGMEAILAENAIEPRQEGYNVADIFAAIKSSLNATAFIACVGDHKTSLISEIRLCFDKKLTLVDCTPATHEGFYSSVYDEKILTNCDANKLVTYYNQLPKSKMETEKHNNYIDKLYSTYQLIQQIIWATL